MSDRTDEIAREIETRIYHFDLLWWRKDHEAIDEKDLDPPAEMIAAALRAEYQRGDLEGQCASAINDLRGHIVAEHGLDVPFLTDLADVLYAKGKKDGSLEMRERCREAVYGFTKIEPNTIGGTVELRADDRLLYLPLTGEEAGDD